MGATVTFEVGESKTFEVKQLPEGVFPLPVSWSASVGGKPTEDVTVTDGVVTVKKWVESCTVTAQVKVSESKTFKKEFTLTVLKPAPTDIKLEPKELTFATGETKEVTISFVGDAPLDDGVTVEPATSDYITIKQEGNKLSITGKKPTTEPVTVKVTSTKNTAVFQTCQVTVTKNSETFEVTLTQPEHGTLEIEGYTTETLKAVAKGTELKVKATPKNEGGVTYELKELKANGVDIKGTMKFIVTAATTVTARFEKKQGGEDNKDKDKDKDPKKPEAVEDAVLVSLSVAPNPFTTQLRILNPEGIVGRYELVNQMGAVLRSGVINGNQMVVDTEAFPAGLYFVRLTGENGAQRVARVVK